MVIKFQDLAAVSAKEVSAALLRNDPEELQFVSITIALSDLDREFIQSVCLRLCSSGDSRVRGNALVSLGHLARRYGFLEEPEVKPVIEASLLDRDDYVRTSAKSAADEITQFLHWRINGHQYGFE